MPTVPSGILYFSVWKYGLYGLILFIGTYIFKYFDLFGENPLPAVLLVSTLTMFPVTWFEYGDYRLSRQWNIDQIRSNCDRLAKAFLYVTCCIFWPKFVVEADQE